MKAATIINAYARGFLTRRLMKTILVEEHVRNIRETLQLVLNLQDHNIGGSPVRDIVLKTQLFQQLQNDLYNFNAIFVRYSVREKMKIIAADREIQKNRKEDLSLSFTGIL